MLQGLLAQVISSHEGRLPQTPAIFLDQRLKGTNNQSLRLQAQLNQTTAILQLRIVLENCPYSQFTCQGDNQIIGLGTPACLLDMR